jgi:uncharacterized repeat protein (TIGR03803 family)
MGNLYGTTEGGGKGLGVVYKVDISTGAQTVMYAFTNAADGGFPEAGLVRDSQGNLCGATLSGV